jgi:hypothetical protein
VPAARATADIWQSAVAHAKRCLSAARDRMSAYHNKNRTHPTYTVGDQVLLSTQNIKLSLPGTKKFHPTFIGPLTIIEIVSPVAARLQLPAHWKRIHNVFHVSLLRRYKPDGKLVFVPPAAFRQEGGEELELTPSRILADQKTAGKRRFLVSFKDMGPEFNQWVPSPRCGTIHCCLLRILTNLLLKLYHELSLVLRCHAGILCTLWCACALFSTLRQLV